MSLNTTPVFPKTAILKSLALTTQSACTTRAPTPTASLAAANIIELLGTGVEQRQIDWIEVTAASSAIGASTSNMLVQIWVWDGTTAFLRDEILVNAQVPSVSAESFSQKLSFTDFTLPKTHKIFVSVTVATTASTNALAVTLSGGEFEA